MGDPSEDEDVRCLCLEPEGCMPKNIYNAGPCKTVPIRISLPHFYDSDPRYLDMIEGLNPDPVSLTIVYLLIKINISIIFRPMIFHLRNSFFLCNPIQIYVNMHVIILSVEKKDYTNKINF